MIMSKMGNLMIDKMNQQQERIIVLPAGANWKPYNFTETQDNFCYHMWQTVVLFTSSVEECKKCGILKENCK